MPVRLSCDHPGIPWCTLLEYTMPVSGEDVLHDVGVALEPDVDSICPVLDGHGGQIQMQLPVAGEANQSNMVAL